LKLLGSREESSSGNGLPVGARWILRKRGRKEGPRFKEVHDRGDATILRRLLKAEAQAEVNLSFDAIII
jgi:hypothetical protein